MWDIDELLEIYEKKAVDGWGSGDVTQWMRDAYKALKGCKKGVQTRWEL